MKDLVKFKSFLQKNGLKATSQRLAVHNAMMALGHASADMVASWIKKNCETSVTVASVYNTLNQMSLLGVYAIRTSADNKTYYDVTTAPHFHMYDCENHKYRDITDQKLVQDILSRIGSHRFRGYKIESLDVQFVVRPKHGKDEYGMNGNN